MSRLRIFSILLATASLAGCAFDPLPPATGPAVPANRPGTAPNVNYATGTILAPPSPVAQAPQPSVSRPTVPQPYAPQPDTHQPSVVQTPPPPMAAKPQPTPAAPPKPLTPPSANTNIAPKSALPPIPTAQLPTAANTATPPAARPSVPTPLAPIPSAPTPAIQNSAPSMAAEPKKDLLADDIVKGSKSLLAAVQNLELPTLPDSPTGLTEQKNSAEPMVSSNVAPSTTPASAPKVSLPSGGTVADQLYIDGMNAWLGLNGQNRDPQLAIEKWRQASGQQPLADYQWGIALLQGQAVPRDEATGLRKIEAAALGGVAEADYLLGVIALNGQFGQRIDQAWALRHLGRAAARGHSQAQYLLALNIWLGRGLPPDNARAAAWALKALPEQPAARKLLAAIGNVTPKRVDEMQAGEADPATIRFVQHSLNLLGIAAGYPDGIAGPITNKAVQEFRTSRALGPGGIDYYVLDRLRAERRAKGIVL